MKKHDVKIGLAALAVCAGLVIAGCAGNSDMTEAAQTETMQTEAVQFETVTQEVAGWKISVEDWKKSSALSSVSVELGYTGVQTSGYEKKAEEGKTFFLVKLLIAKDKSKETIEWDKMKLTDSQAREYTRCEDEFITELGMKRMTGNKLNFGSNEGWIAFEIDEDAQDLVLSYAFENETLEWRNK